MNTQQVIILKKDYNALNEYFSTLSCKRILLVCGHSIKKLDIDSFFETLEERKGIKVVRFHDFTPNPTYDSVVKGVKKFHEESCDFIAAVGGGSAIDVAKCIKLFAYMDGSKNYLMQKIIPNEIPLAAIPTTAGTGSEATRYAVIYYQGEKQSITDESCIPQMVCMDASALKTLPLYHKKAAMLDALCHALEAFWSVNSTDESKVYSEEAIRLILDNRDSYLRNQKQGCENMLKAANIAGKAINITQTTAGHALCYKLTGVYGIAHGHAAALCVAELWPYMLQHTEDCRDRRGRGYLESILKKIAVIMGCSNAEEAADYFRGFLSELDLRIPEATGEEMERLCSSVNAVRLKNNPVALTETAIRELYYRILNK